MALTLETFCERLGNFRQDRSGGLVKPYKPVLLAAVVILIHKGKQPNRSVLLDGGLRSALHQLPATLYPRWPHQAKPEYPFRHLENDGIWKLVPIEGAASTLRAARDQRAEAWDVLRHVRCAQLDEDVYRRLATSFEDRFRMLQLLARRYFPSERGEPPAALDVRDVGSDLRPARDGSPGDTGPTRRRWRDAHRACARSISSCIGVTLHPRAVASSSRLARSTACRDVRCSRPRTRSTCSGTKRGRGAIELKRKRSADVVVGQVSRYLGWIAEERRGHRESAVGAIIVRHADPKLRYAVKANERLSLWEFDE